MKVINLNISKKRIVFLIITAMFLLVIGVLIITSRTWKQVDPWVILTFSINIILFLVQLILAIKAHPFSFDMIFWLFNLFFFGFAPFLQHVSNVYVWSLTPTYEEVTSANLLVLLWSGCYIFARDAKFLFFSKATQKRGNSKKKDIN